MFLRQKGSELKLTLGERRALMCYAVVLVGFLPPVIVWASGVREQVLGLPFLLFWAALMVLATSVLMTIAFYIKDWSDRE